jgi:hypothetical protein
LAPSGRSPTTGSFNMMATVTGALCRSPALAAPLADHRRNARPGHWARGSRRSWRGSPQRNTKNAF